MLLVLTLSIIRTLWSFVTETRDKDTVVLDMKFGKTLLMSVMVHCFAKYSLKMSAFCLQLDTEIPLSMTRDVGIALLIDNVPVRGPKMFLSSFRIGKFQTQF